MVISVINRDQEIYKKYKSYCLERGIEVTNDLWSYISKTVEKYDQGGKLDGFFDPDFVPIPKITDSFDDKLKYLKIQKNEKLETLRDEFYRLHIMCKALLDSEDKKNFSLDYVQAWRRYK